MPSSDTSPDTPRSAIREALYDTIFGYESLAGRLFDLALIVLIFASVAAVILDSVPAIHARAHGLLYQLEWGFTLLFTLEYVLRLYSARNMRRYAFSFYGVVDLLSVLPTYLAFLLPGMASMVVIRILRVLRIFRILKLSRYVGEVNVLMTALLQARRKILVFLYGVFALVVVFGALMYVIEGPENGFTSIPISMYWAIVSLTTVGYGDITPHTALGRTVASMAMVTGYAIIAVPFGIFSAELLEEYQRQQKRLTTDGRHCDNCELQGHEADARFCRRCGSQLSSSSDNRDTMSQA